MMKLKFVIVSLFAFVFTLNVQAQESHPAFATLKSAGEAYDARNAEAFAAFFTEDALLVNPMGGVSNGREAIFQGHNYHFKQMEEQGVPIEESADDWEVQGIQELADNLVYGVVDSATSGLTFGVLFEEQADGNWLIKSIQMTPIQQMGDN
ncbi:MAG: SgcJ/EcaC family oxidoreductase [Bacteroidetes bacterium]|nr:SgcJ/EcaC family oxidoreductase [Bacteroidota bacterium]